MQTDRTFLSIESAAKLAGYSVRQFRRIIDIDHIPIVRMQHGAKAKFYITGPDFNRWESSRKGNHGS